LQFAQATLAFAELDLDHRGAVIIESRQPV